MTTGAFCGFDGKLTGEHVFGDWIARLNLTSDRVPHGAGPLNRLGRDLGTYPPFRQTVQDVCGRCNSGWMSGLEAIAQRVLSPLILGRPHVIEPADQAPTTVWVHKSALVAMLVSSDEARADGYGVPPGEYHDLYRARENGHPVPGTQCWIARYEGTRLASARVVPVDVVLDGHDEPDRPMGYLMTILVGQLLLQAVRFATPHLAINVVNVPAMHQIWPILPPVKRSSHRVVTDDDFLDVAGGRRLVSTEPPLSIRSWRPATELSRSRLVDGMVELPTICGDHVVYYPAVLAADSARRRGDTWALLRIRHLVRVRGQLPDPDRSRRCALQGRRTGRRDSIALREPVRTLRRDRGCERPLRVEVGRAVLVRVARARRPLLDAADLESVVEANRRRPRPDRTAPPERCGCSGRRHRRRQGQAGCCR